MITGNLTPSFVRQASLSAAVAALLTSGTVSAGIIGVGESSPGATSHAYAVSGDGKVVTGVALFADGNRAFRVSRISASCPAAIPRGRWR